MKNCKAVEEPDIDDVLEFPDKKAQLALKIITVKELKLFCDLIGIKCHPSMKKAELVDALAKVPIVLEKFDEFKRPCKLPLH